MDGVVNPLLSSSSRYDLRASSVATGFLTYCQLQTECSQHFPADQPPHIMLSRLLYELDGNSQQCANAHFSQYNLNADMLRGLLFRMMQSGDTYFDRTVIPAIIFRLNRCNEEDVTVLDFFFKTSFGTGGDADGGLANTPGLIYS
ncbi:unnamed protein product, partial [Didymodactylos carnosus]